MKASGLVLSAAATLLAATAPLHAQDDARRSGVALGMMGGATIPVSDYKNVANTGWNLGAFVDLGRS
ncbi:MAG: hypothetical protein ABIT38_16780, partial [Gemmatimonadaceae bacterium]